MPSLLSGLVHVVSALVVSLFPHILGTSDISYPYTFSGSDFTCNDYRSCCMHCIYPNYLGTGDGQECQLYFPNASETSCSQAGSYSNNQTITVPHTFSGSGLTCNSIADCCNDCAYTKIIGGTMDGEQCQQIFPNFSTQCPNAIPKLTFDSGYFCSTKQICCNYCANISSANPDYNLCQRIFISNQGAGCESLLPTPTPIPSPPPTPTPRPSPSPTPRPSPSPPPTPTPPPLMSQSGNATPWPTLKPVSLVLPHTFSGSGKACIVYRDCCNHCAYTFKYGGTGDGEECRRIFTSFTTQCPSTTIPKVLTGPLQPNSTPFPSPSPLHPVTLAPLSPISTSSGQKANSDDLLRSQTTSIIYSVDVLSNPEVVHCLQSTFGEKRYQEFTTGTGLPPNVNEIAKGRSCFSPLSPTHDVPLIIDIPAEQRSCLQSVVGNDRFESIMAGRIKPTESEMLKVKQCFTQASTPHTEFLPQPPEKILFMPESKKDIKITNAESQQKDQNNAIRLSGKGLPNSVVDIYVFSQPIVVTTKTDANGDWSYDLRYHLPEGDHRAYTIIRHPDKGFVRSEVFSFGVAYARDTATSPETLIVQPVQERTEWRFILLAGGIIAIAVVGMLVLFQSKFKHKSTDTEVETVEDDIAIPKIELVSIREQKKID